jgi:hypothetical protein
LPVLAKDTVGVAKGTTGAAKDKLAESAAAAQASTESYLDLAEEKLNVFSKGTAETAEGAKDSAAETANKAGSKAQGVKDAAADTASGAADKTKVEDAGVNPCNKGEGEAVRWMKAAGYVIGNLDATLILQRPKLSPHKEEIRANLCELLEAGPSVVNLKAMDELAMYGLPKLATSLRFLSIAKYSS